MFNETMDHIITAIKAQRRNQQRVNIYLDGEFAFGLSRIVAAWLYVGEHINDDKIAQLKAEDGREVAFQQALKFLSYRPRSEAELRANLQEHKFLDADIDDVMTRLRQGGILNDAGFAQAWIENRSEMRPRGRRALVYELRQKGIPDHLIDQALENLDEQDLAYQAAAQRASRWKHLEWFDFRKKMYAYLTRRGFNYESASQATARAWSETHHVEYPQGEEDIQ
jgi:regulatory protein